MSGRKKNRKPQRGQPPHQLLDELSSLRELLGSDMEVDIPLLDQVAAPGSAEHRAPQQPATSQRPLEEADLPVLFSPVDEEPEDDFSPELSESDLALLRPLQDLPRTPRTAMEPPATPLAEPQETVSAAEPSATAPPSATTTTPATTTTDTPAALQTEAPTSPRDSASLPRDEKPSQRQATTEAEDRSGPATAQKPREEFQPGLFDAPTAKQPTDNAQPEQQQAPRPAPTAERPTPDVPSERLSERPSTEKPVVTTTNHERVPMSENPFLPPHIRARLTGGRVPKSEEFVTITPAASGNDGTESSAAGADTRSPRQQLIDQLMAEQLPELERQLRANITALVDEIYPQD